MFGTLSQRHADKVRIPILLLHGIEDSVVEVEQSRAMHAKLLRAKRDVRYKELGGDDHWLSSASTRTMMLQELETFLAQTLEKQGESRNAGVRDR